MATRAGLLAQLDETVAQLLELCRNISDPDLPVYPEWRARDVLGHIVFWHASFARNVRDLVNDVAPTPLKGSYRALNERCLAEMRGKSMAEMLAELEAAHQVIQEAILSPKITLIPYKKGSREYTPTEHLEIVNAHIQEHLNAMRQANKEENHAKYQRADGNAT